MLRSDFRPDIFVDNLKMMPKANVTEINTQLQAALVLVLLSALFTPTVTEDYRWRVPLLLLFKGCPCVHILRVKAGVQGLELGHGLPLL